MKHITPDTPLARIWKLRADQRAALDRLNLRTARDLLFHFPHRYSNIGELRSIAQLSEGDDAVVYGTISRIKAAKTFRTKIPITEAVLADSTGSIRVRWFHQPYIAKLLSEGENVQLRGKVSGSGPKRYIANPEIKDTKILPIDTSDSLFAQKETGVFGTPIYHESRGITSRWIHHHIEMLLKHKVHTDIPDPIPDDILSRYHLPSLDAALVWIHAPRNERDARAAKKRFAFDEIFFVQLVRQEMRAAHRAQKANTISLPNGALERFLRDLPFTPTDAQKRAIQTITNDMAQPRPMRRLLEGDVGSGKTTVAAAASFAVVYERTHPRQVAYMAPTEVLAKQIFQTFTTLFSGYPFSIGLLTGAECYKFPSKVTPREATRIPRSQLLKWTRNGEIAILIGTHAIMHQGASFKNLSLAIIDEQHRFGTLQRAALTKKHETVPHLLSMTATPIPRTLALTLYGDLDLTLLDEMPSGRKPVKTRIVHPHQRKDVYEAIRTELSAGRQLYVICPRINEADPETAQSLNVRSVLEEAERLKHSVFPEYRIGVLHGKLTPREKDAVMEAMLKHEIDILVATSVVEVGVNVPNATVIVIEGAERFGLAQLHQLRGRVIRSTHQAYCYIFADVRSEKTLTRLRVLETARNGFELAEQDLQLRGAGELLGSRQWGMSDIAMEAIKNIKMVEAARSEAARIISDPTSLARFPTLGAALERYRRHSHFE